LIGSDGASLEDYLYDAYGNGINPPADPLSRLLYTGEPRDNETGLDYLDARYYTPATGRFITLDSFPGNNFNPQSLHKYIYCHGNSINGIDPSGKMTITETMAVVSVIGIAGAILQPALHNAQEHYTASLAARNPWDRPDAISYLGPELQNQYARDMLEISDPDLHGMAESFWLKLGHNNQVVTYQKQLAEKRFIDSIDNAFHAVQYGGMALGMSAPLAGGFARTKIIWGKPHGSSAHWQTIVNNVTKRSASGQVKEIYTHRAISTITKGRVKSRLLPDWGEKLYNGKFNIFEVRSPKQNITELIKKGQTYKQLMGNKLQKYQIIDIGGEVP